MVSWNCYFWGWMCVSCLCHVTLPSCRAITSLWTLAEWSLFQMETVFVLLSGLLSEESKVLKTWEKTRPFDIYEHVGLRLKDGQCFEGMLDKTLWEDHKSFPLGKGRKRWMIFRCFSWCHIPSQMIFVVTFFLNLHPYRLYFVHSMSLLTADTEQVGYCFHKSLFTGWALSSECPAVPCLWKQIVGGALKDCFVPSFPL